MLPHDTKRKIENIVSGNVTEGETDIISTIRNHLIRRFGTSRTNKKEFDYKSIIKERETEFLKEFAQANGLWKPLILKNSNFIGKGGEAIVYLQNDAQFVFKVNHGVYYATWLEFFQSLALHNLFFDNTQYHLSGIIPSDSEYGIAVVLEQNFVTTNCSTDIDDVRYFLQCNGFENFKNHDYKNKKLGLILEDMHDENVLTNNDTLFFIDSVFYIMEA